MSPSPSPSFLADARRGLIDILPMLIGAVPFAMLCGALAAQKGLSPAELGLMSATVYAGGAQFIAVEMWTSPTPVLAIVATTLLVNARHLLMGAAIAPRLGHLPPAVRRLYVSLLTDESWAVGMRRARTHGLTPGYLLGMVVPFYLQWPAAGVVGCVFGGLVTDPARYGFDFVFTAVFLCLVVGLWQGRRSAPPVVAAALTATLAHLWLPGVWYIFLGAVAGTLAGALTAPDETAAEARR